MIMNTVNCKIKHGSYTEHGVQISVAIWSILNFSSKIWAQNSQTNKWIHMLNKLCEKWSDMTNRKSCDIKMSKVNIVYKAQHITEHISKLIAKTKTVYVLMIT